MKLRPHVLFCIVLRASVFGAPNTATPNFVAILADNCGRGSLLIENESAVVRIHVETVVVAGAGEKSRGHEIAGSAWCIASRSTKTTLS